MIWGENSPMAVRAIEGANGMTKATQMEEPPPDKGRLVENFTAL
jgi:hypothetical protein